MVSGGKGMKRYKNCFIEEMPQWLILGWFHNPILHRLYLQNYKASGAEINPTYLDPSTKYPPSRSFLNVIENNLYRKCQGVLDGATKPQDLELWYHMLRTKYQYSIEKPQNKYSTPWKEIKSDNKPLWGGNLLLPHLNVQVQDDSKWKCLLGIYRRLGGIITTNGIKPTWIK